MNPVSAGVIMGLILWGIFVVLVLPDSHLSNPSPQVKTECVEKIQKINHKVYRTRCV